MSTSTTNLKRKRLSPHPTSTPAPRFEPRTTRSHSEPSTAISRSYDEHVTTIVSTLPLKAPRMISDDGAASLLGSASSASSVLTESSDATSDSDPDGEPDEKEEEDAVSASSVGSAEDGDAETEGGQEEEERAPLRSRLSAFLPQLAASNQELDRRKTQGDVVGGGFELAVERDEAEGRDAKRKGKKSELVRELDGEGTSVGVEGRLNFEEGGEQNVEEREEEPYIEMNLGLGVLEQQEDISSEPDDEKSDDEETVDQGTESTLEAKGTEKSILDKMKRVGSKSARPDEQSRPKILEV